MRRREFIALLGGTAALPLTARAQERKTPRVGVLVVGDPDPEPFWRPFRESLRELGYVDGQNILFEFRSAKGDATRLAELAADLVLREVDVILGYQTPTVTAAKQATREIPIIMTPAGDPVGTGLVASLARPGGNVTGVSAATAELAGKCVEIIREIIPSAGRVAALCNATDPFAKPFLEQIQLAAQAMGIASRALMESEAKELEGAFSTMVTEQLDAVVVQPSVPVQRAVELALKHAIPAVSPARRFAQLGGLMSYFADVAEISRNAALYVDKILKGAKPSDLPVMQPTKFQLALNLKTANALGLPVPPTLLARADEVIE